ncbi:MAG: hypothetical protein H0U55_09140 [Rubrobacteraceae bacterium]|nr:hypothetical protein [Rubrobacteraceae bacterium]
MGGPRRILGGPGEDFVYSQDETDDTIYVSDGEPDVVDDCGDGTDTVYFDGGLDEVNQTTCENLVPR